MGDESWQIALQRFTDFGAQPGVAAYLAMFDPEGSAVYRLITRDGRILAGQAFYDRAAVMAGDGSDGTIFTSS